MTTKAALRLSDIDPRSTPGFNGDKEKALAELEKLTARLDELQEQLTPNTSTGCW